MAKLGASTRSQAVALALQRDEIAAGEPAAAHEPEPPRDQPGAARDASTALRAMLDGRVSLYDVAGGSGYQTEEDGLALRQVGGSTGSEGTMPEVVFLGEGALGRAALERRAQLIQAGGTAMIAAPMLAGGRLLGVIALATRVSRPIGRSELLLLQAFATRVGEVLLAGAEIGPRLERALARFRASWAGTPRAL
jgi:hypothetical protein